MHSLDGLCDYQPSSESCIAARWLFIRAALEVPREHHSAGGFLGIMGPAFLKARVSSLRLTVSRSAAVVVAAQHMEQW